MAKHTIVEVLKEPGENDEKSYISIIYMRIYHYRTSYRVDHEIEI